MGVYVFCQDVKKQVQREYDESKAVQREVRRKASFLYAVSKYTLFVVVGQDKK